MGIVSRGGAFLATWMLKRHEENPLNARFDELLDLLHHYDVTISIGDALRPGSLLDASDRAQFAELEEIAGLTKRAHARGVQVMVEGPGHIPLHEIEMNMKKQQELCAGAPFLCAGAGGVRHRRRLQPRHRRHRGHVAAMRSARRSCATSRPRSTSACRTWRMCARA